MTEDEFLEETAKSCRACPECWQVPCPACCAGGICDAICDCDHDRYEVDSYERERDDDDEY